MRSYTKSSILPRRETKRLILKLILFFIQCLVSLLNYFQIANGAFHYQSDKSLLHKFSLTQGSRMMSYFRFHVLTSTDMHLKTRSIGAIRKMLSPDEL